MDLDEKKIKHMSGAHINECVQFGADPNKILAPVNLNVFSWVDCWALILLKLKLVFAPLILQYISH